MWGGVKGSRRSRTVVEEIVVERPLKEHYLKDLLMKKTAVEGLVAESTVNKKTEVDLRLIKLLGVEELLQVLYSQISIEKHFNYCVLDWK